MPAEHKFVKHIIKKILARELNMLFRRSRNKDTILSAGDLFEFPEEQIDIFCFKRGINIDQKFNRKIEDLRLWLSISNLRNVPH
jgi:hypothetical protein